MDEKFIARVTKAYEADQQRLEIPLAVGELPLAYESITDEWLTDVLCANFPGAAVVGHRLGAPDNGSSNRRIIHLTYNEAGTAAGLPSALFCKASHDLVNRIVLGAANSASGEEFFYSQIRPQIEIEAPKSYFARVDDQSFNSMIMLEDLTGRSEFLNHASTISLQRAKSQIRLLAGLHAACHEGTELGAKAKNVQTWPEFFRKTLNMGMKEGSQAGFLGAEEVIPERLYARFDEIWPATVASVDDHKSLPYTLAHGDVHLKNWYVAGNGEMGLADWQCVSRGHWGRDLAYTLSTALTVEDRRQWERELIELYLDLMREAGAPVPDFNQAWDIYRRQLMTALTWWTICVEPPATMPDMQPRDTTMEFVKRIATAIDDLESLDSFRTPAFT
ncbi:phosphotransferase [Arthrobacter mobilis]|uniref:Phosphotransferase n=1 Tax=Arthrobacter mobilis TaxID=2724944 RepID=A0A7X6K7G7_9MICC|nr:phosphotransferase [Arthrobacter mobilis]NKX56565.1 phosphotransferase [Arthrobacter mobilis]